MKIGNRVTILGGMREFIGKTGRIIDIENYSRSKSQAYYRVRLDEPVMIPGVGKVEDDLWQKEFLKRE